MTVVHKAFCTATLSSAHHLVEKAFRAVSEPAYAVCSDILYADDMLLMNCNAAKLQKHLDIIVDEGKHYG